MGGLGLQEIVIIGIVLALLFGPSQLPKLGRSLGESVKEFGNAGKELGKAFHDDDEV